MPCWSNSSTKLSPSIPSKEKFTFPGNRHALFPAYCADFGDGLNGAYLIVGIHDGHKAGVLPDGPL